MADKLSPFMQAKTAQNIFLFTMMIRDRIISGKISYELFNEPVPLQSEGVVFAQINPTYKKTDLREDVDNLSLGTMGVCFTALDTALDDAFKSKQNKSDIPLRAIIYMIRCAFAHDPLLPAWKLKLGSSYLKTYCIDELGICFDFVAMNGQYLYLNQFQGWKGVFDLIQYCVLFIEKLPLAEDSA